VRWAAKTESRRPFHAPVARGAMFDRRLAGHGDAAVAARGDRHGQGDQLPNLRARMVGPGASVVERDRPRPWLRNPGDRKAWNKVGEVALQRFGNQHSKRDRHE